MPLENLGRTRHNACMESAAISKEIEDLESQLSSLRTRADEDNSSFSALEQQIAALQDRLTETEDAVRAHEAQLAEKRAELSQAQHLERLQAYEQDLADYRDAAERVGKAADTFLAELETYDGKVVRLRKLRDEIRDALGDDQRMAEIDAAFNEEDAELSSAWKAVVGAAEWRIREAAKAEFAEQPAASTDDADLVDDLQKRTDEGRTSRILEYFNKG
jgi:chromosome segregation ATPase